MATRQETRQRREELKEHLRTVNRLAAGASRPAPPVRELASQFSLSVNLVLDAQRELIDEGVLHSIPRVGTFIGRPQNSQSVFLMVAGSTPTPEWRFNQVALAFEERVASRGATALVLDRETALEHWRLGRLPQVAGVFDWAFGEHGFAWKREVPSDLPHVRFHTLGENELGYDQVSFDDVDGGQRATQHLIDAGHRRIAFLAFHAEENARPGLSWSVEREIGWKKALDRADLASNGLAWHSSDNVKNETTSEATVFAAEIVARFWPDFQPTAIVAANDQAAAGVMKFLRHACVPPSQWPAIVGFDGEVAVGRSLVTSLRLPWGEIGQTAADLLWERANSLLPSQPHHRLVPMKLIQRLTCRTDWSQTVAQNTLAVATR